MLQDNGTSGSVEDLRKKNICIHGWQPSCSCDLDHLCKCPLPLTSFDWPSGFGRWTDGRTTDGRQSMGLCEPGG